MSTKRLISQTPNTSTIMHTDAHVKNRQVFQTIFHDDESLEKTKRLRDAEIFKRGTKIPFADQQVYHAFSIPEGRYALLKRDFPDMMEAIKSKDEAVRMKAARELSILHPEFVVL